MVVNTILDDLQLLINTPNGIPKLRELILQLAVRGKLVPQDANDEPASVLLEKVKAEKERLIKEKKIKAPKPLPPIDENEIPYELPNGWEWVRLGDYAYIIMGQSPKSEHYNTLGNGIPFYQGKAEFGKLNPTPSKWCDSPQKISEKDDILISVRAPVGPTNICEELSCIGRGLAAIRNMADSSNLFLLQVIRAFESDISALGVGSTFTAISRRHLENTLIPVAPEKEQKRIVTKVDRLMTLCDQLEEKIEQAQQDGERLMEAVVEKVLNGE